MRTFIWSVLMLGSLGVCTQARAHTFCVTNAAQLQQALNASGDSGAYAAESNSINIATGQYNVGAATGNQPFHFTSTQTAGSTTLAGGFNGTCTQFAAGPEATVLDGQQASGVLDIATSRDFTITRLTLQNGADIPNARAGGLYFLGSASTRQRLVLQYNILRNNHSSTGLGGFYLQLSNGYYVDMLSNLVYGNSSQAADGGGDILSEASGGSCAHNTFYGNTTGDANHIGGMFFGGIADSFFIEYNIFWSNTNAGLKLGTTDVSLLGNDVGVLAGFPPSASSGELSVAPLFVDVSNDDFRLQRTSPLLAAAHVHASTYYDLQQHAFPTEGLTDIGSYAETIFSDTFETY